MQTTAWRRLLGAGRLAAPGFRRARRRLCEERGVTLVEVLAASMILAIGLVGVGAMMTNGSIAHDKAANYTIAAARANEEMERIREAGYLGANIGTTIFPTPVYAIPDSSHATFAVDELRDGHGTVTIVSDSEAQATNPATGQPWANLKRITIDITWSGAHSLRGSYRAVTLLANRP